MRFSGLRVLKEGLTGTKAGRHIGAIPSPNRNMMSSSSAAAGTG